MNRPGVAASSSSNARSTSVVPSLGPHMRPALMLMTQGCGPAVREMKSTASSSRTESPKLASPPVLRSARWTKIRSASGAIPAGPSASAVAGRDVHGPGAVRTAASSDPRSRGDIPAVRKAAGPAARGRSPPGRERSRTRTAPGAARSPDPAGPRTTGTAWPRPCGRPLLAAPGSPGHRNAAESMSTPQSMAATTTPAPVSPSPGRAGHRSGATSGPAGPAIGRTAGGGSAGGGSNPGLRMRGALRLRTSGRARTAMTSRARIRQVAIVPKRETIRTSGISIPGRASLMIASSTRSPSVPASARNSSHRAGSMAPSANRRSRTDGQSPQPLVLPLTAIGMD